MTNSNFAQICHLNAIKLTIFQLHFVKVVLEYPKKLIIKQKWGRFRQNFKDDIDKGEKRKFSTGAPRSVKAVDHNNGIKVDQLFP